jgi:hypothetical protein
MTYRGINGKKVGSRWTITVQGWEYTLNTLRAVLIVIDQIKGVR